MVFRPKGGLRWLILIVFLLAGPVLAKKKHAPLPPPAPLPPAKILSQGTYVDSSGKAYPWQITPTHMLEWNGSPYLPVGGSFTPRYWVEGQTAANWTADTEALQTLHQHGVTDLLLNAGSLGLTNIPTAAVQRLLDYLDIQGFQYGLKIADFPKEPLTGYTIEPAIYRNPSPPMEGLVKFSHIPGLLSAVYLLVAARNGEKIQSGMAQVTADGTAQVDIQAGGPGDVLLLYPLRSFSPGTPESHLPNLWKGYGEYRDRLIAFFNHIKLGKGFRFFLDPLTNQIGMDGEVQNLVPTSTGFRLGFEAWLDQKYAHSLDELNRRWGLENHDMKSFSTAARCIPLWYGYKGAPKLYDPATQQTFDVFNANGIHSDYWSDLQTYKLQSIHDDMDAIADALKSAVADVPVVYTWTQHSPLFSDTDLHGGYDGLGVDAYGHGLDLTHGAAAYVYAQAQESPKTTWVIASATADAPPSQKVLPGFLSQAVLEDDWDGLRDIGVRGFYVRSLQRLPAASNKDVNLVNLPDQLRWLGTYAAILQASTQTLETEKPDVLWYPQNVEGPDIGVRFLPDGVWWLPTYQPGQKLILGPGLRGYELMDPDTNQLINVLWSPQGETPSADFYLGKNARPLIITPSGTLLPKKQKNNVWTIPVGDTPTVVRDTPPLPLPLGAPMAADMEAERLVLLAKSLNIDVDLDGENLFRAENDTHNDLADAGIRYSQFEAVIYDLVQRLRPFAWLEGESSTNTTFTSITPDPDASGGAYLSLNTDQDPSGNDLANMITGSGYYATYHFTVNAPGVYTLWMAATPPGPSASPYTWQMDDSVPTQPSSPVTAGGIYAGKFEWANLGPVNLHIGKNTLTIQIMGRDASDQRYHLGIDAFCITRATFQPDGPLQPSVSTWLPPAPPPDSGKKKKK